MGQQFGQPEINQDLLERPRRPGGPIAVLGPRPRLVLRPPLVPELLEIEQHHRSLAAGEMSETPLERQRGRIRGLRPIAGPQLLEEPGPPTRPGRLLELPVFEAGSQSASVYLFYLMQAPHQHPSGYSTTAPLAADRRLRELQKTPCRYLRQLGIREVVTHYEWKRHCGGRLIARAGRIAAYRVR